MSKPITNPQAMVSQVYDKKLRRYGVMWDRLGVNGWVRWDNDEVEVIKTTAIHGKLLRYDIGGSM